MEQTELSLQNVYKIAVQAWMNAIRPEEDLAFAHPTVSQVDTWETARFKEDDVRNRALQAKKEYEDTIRPDLFDF